MMILPPSHRSGLERSVLLVKVVSNHSLATNTPTTVSVSLQSSPLSNSIVPLTTYIPSEVSMLLVTHPSDPRIIKRDQGFGITKINASSPTSCFRSKISVSSIVSTF